MNTKKKPESVVGTIRFVGLIHEELVEASQALHRVAESGEAGADPDAIKDALNLCFAALWHAKDMTGDDASFVVVRRPKSEGVRRMMKTRTFPQVTR